MLGVVEFSFLLSPIDMKAVESIVETRLISYCLVKSWCYLVGVQAPSLALDSMHTTMVGNKEHYLLPQDQLPTQSSDTTLAQDLEHHLLLPSGV